MAKQNPATDPVSAAMSAIESALNLTDDETIEPVVETPPHADFARSKSQGPILKPSAPAPEATPLLRPGPSPMADAEVEAGDRRDPSSQ